MHHDLVQQLDGDDDASYAARVRLIAIGPEAVPAIADALPGLGSYGRLTAIEVFEEVADPRCGPALIALLDDDDPVVRSWAATALAHLGLTDAAEPVRRAYRACLDRRTPPDWHEPVALRQALTDLGARTPVVPPLTASLRAAPADDSPGWPSARFADVINDLADHGQVILCSEFVQWVGGRRYFPSWTRPDWQPDWYAPWADLVEETRTQSLLEATETPVGDDIFVDITWMNRTDLYPL
ncbi:HEAT repeat domain-containing protein [Streptomyces sp. NPDC090022]|uniref:HEAT repeat domain-containing protein n=1 Tax=Streptomyces sp. NPDC090022 TaxID=3365920 RepID=UPI003825B13B